MNKIGIIFAMYEELEEMLKLVKLNKINKIYDLDFYIVNYIIKLIPSFIFQYLL